MKIVVTNDYGCLINEFYSDSDDPTEALKEFIEKDDMIFAEGDMIQIRR